MKFGGDGFSVDGLLITKNIGIFEPKKLGTKHVLCIFLVVLVFKNKK